MHEPRPAPRWRRAPERPEPMDLLVQVPGMTGAVLMTRDGLPVVSQYERLRRAETFVAMAAAALTAAEVMAFELDLSGGVLFRVDHPQLCMAGMAVSDEFIVVAFGEPGCPIEQAFARLRKPLGE